MTFCLGKKNASWRKQKLQERFYFSLRAICYLHTKLILLVSSNILWVLFGFFLFVCLLCFVISRKVHGYSQNLASRYLDWAGDERRHQPFSYSWGMRTHPFWLICPLPSSQETQSCTETFIWWVKSEPASHFNSPHEKGFAWRVTGSQGWGVTGKVVGTSCFPTAKDNQSRAGT